MIEPKQSRCIPISGIRLPATLSFLSKSAPCIFALRGEPRLDLRFCLLDFSALTAPAMTVGTSITHCSVYCKKGIHSTLIDGHLSKRNDAPTRKLGTNECKQLSILLAVTSSHYKNQTHKGRGSCCKKSVLYYIEVIALRIMQILLKKTLYLISILYLYADRQS